MSWSNTYVGLPYRLNGRDVSGLDCWGLAVLVYAHELGIGLPSYIGLANLQERAEVAAMIDAERSNPHWRRVDAPLPFDLAVFARGRLDSHVAVMVSARHMLHVDTTAPARVEALSSERWAARPPVFYRHASVGSS